MNTAYQSLTTYHGSYEAREAAFSRSLSGLIPCKYAGPQRFWMEFGRISREVLHHIPETFSAYITSNPRDCLAFGSALQVLSAANMMAARDSAVKCQPIEEIAASFHLTHALEQPIRTLSGGETVKLALAKIWCIAGISEKLSVASPFSWLSAGNRHLLDFVLTRYLDHCIPIKIFSLNGEDDQQPAPPAYQRLTHEQKIGCRIYIRDVTLPLGAMISAITSGTVFARIDDVDVEIASPCLLAGENGHGKSLLAKALCNAIAKNGQLWVETKNAKGSGRLLFQDVITQALLRTTQSITNAPGCPDPDLASSLFRSIHDTASHIHHEISQTAKTSNHRHLTSPAQSLLEMKIILVAVRLCARPVALVLDEPDWGLTRNTALAFVLAVIKTAHEIGVPVFLISHKPWWRSITRSILNVTKRTDPFYRFVISLKPERQAIS